MSTLWLSFLFGTIGMGYLVYGRKQRQIVPLVSGLVLMGTPYLVSNLWAVGGLCLVAMAVPFVVKI